MGGQARRVTREDCDLATPAGQRYLMNLVYELNPEHIFVAPECKLWGNWSRFNMSRGPAQWDAISRARLAQGTILHLCSRLCQIQIDAGRHFHLEQPAGSSMLDQEALRPVIRATCPVLVDMCRFNLRLPGSSKLIRKRTVIRSTSSLMVECLDGMMCRKNHAHQQVAGSARVGGRTIQVSHFAASYSRGFAMAVAQVLLKESHAALAFAFPALEPPRTRKRFKTNVGAPPVPVNNPVDRKRGLPEKARASKKSRVPALPDLEIPQVFDAELWQSIPQELSSCAVRVGTCSIDNANRVFLRIQNLLPKVSIARMFSTRHAKQLQMPIGAPPPSESPWRLSLGWSSVDDTTPSVLAFERRRDLSRPEMIRPCAEQELLLTVFIRAKPRDPPLVSESVLVPEAMPSDGMPAGNAPARDGRPPDCLEGWGPPPVPLHGPAFRSLTPEEKTDLIRLHRNLGHPSPQKLAEHLQSAKAYPHAAKDYVRDACVESSSPKHQRPSKLHDPKEFNDTIGLDTFYWGGSAGFQVHVLHVIDEASCFQTGRRIAERYHALPAFRDSWIQWDPAGELRSNELEGFLQGLGTTLFVTAAAWQRGRIERHGQVLKDMLTRMDTQKPIATLAKFGDSLAQCFSAKNALVRVRGFSPEQLVLGKSAPIPASLTSCDSAASHEMASTEGLEGEAFRQNLSRRAAARQAFHESDNDQTIRRALLRRSIYPWAVVVVLDQT